MCLQSSIFISGSTINGLGSLKILLQDYEKSTNIFIFDPAIKACPSLLKWKVITVAANNPNLSPNYEHKVAIISQILFC